jgi:hypothetical protein
MESTIWPDDVCVMMGVFDLLERRAEAAAVLAQRQAELDRRTAGFRPEEIARAKAHRDPLASYLAQLEHGPRPQEMATAKAEFALATATHHRALASSNGWKRCSPRVLQRKKSWIGRVSRSRWRVAGCRCVGNSLLCSPNLLARPKRATPFTTC